MSLSRVRNRVAAVVAALPVLFAAAPAGLSFAAGEYLVENLIANGQVIGPNVGYLGQGVGINGTVPVFKITAPSAGSTISAIRLTLTNDNTAFNHTRDLASGDGLALYADVDGLAGFSMRDKAEGLKVSGFSLERSDASGNVPYRLAVPPAGVTGAETYYVTMHPNTSIQHNMRVRFEVGAGKVEGTGGSGPASTVSTPAGTDRMIVDSARPGNPNRLSFASDQKPPGTEDSYSVQPSVAGTDTTMKVVFFNSSTDTSSAAILTRPGFNPALAPEAQLPKLAFDDVINPASPTQANQISIGDGTGVIPGSVPVARNNQKSNAVWARTMDAAGNLSASPAVLSHCVLSGTACNATKNGNAVVGPEAPTGTQAVTAGDGTPLNPGTPVTAINMDNEDAVPVRSTSTESAGATRANNQAAWDTTSEATKVMTRVIQLGPDGQPDLTKVSTASTLTWDLTTNHVIDTRDDIVEGNAVAVSYNVDDYGNLSAPKYSVTLPKDVTRPTASVQMPSGAQSGAAGELITVQFSEPMDKTRITETPVTGGVDSLQRCAIEPTDGTSVSDVLDVVDGAPAGEARTWGYNNCFRWSTDGSSATIRLGDNAPGCGPTPPQSPCVPRAGIADKVYLAGTLASPRLTDAAGNQATGISPFTGNSGYTEIIAPPATPVTAVTRDTDADGKLDAIDVTFTLGVDVTTFPAAQDNISVVSGAIAVPVNTAEWIAGDHKKLRFGFASEFGTGVTPAIRLTQPGPGQPTGLVGDDARPVDVFSKPTTDGAGPQVKAATTVDFDNDGHLDRVVVTFSEPIQHALDHNSVTVCQEATCNDPQPGGYRIVGFEQSGTGNTARNRVEPSEGTTDTKIIHLSEKTTFDTGTMPTMLYHCGTALVPNVSGLRQWYDASNNVGPVGPSPACGTSTTTAAFSRQVSDGVAPFIAARRTRDLDGDGAIDGMDIQFSEIIPDTRSGAQFTVTGFEKRDQYGLGSDGIRMELHEIATVGTGDTGRKPTVQFLGGMEDQWGNVTKVETAPVASLDGAPPVIIGACPTSPKGSNGRCPEDDPANDATGNPDKGAKLNLFYSELITNTTSTPADYKVEQPQGTDKGVPTGAVQADTGTGDLAYSTVTLSFAANTLDYLADLNVRHALAGAVSDRATPAVNLSTQVADVIATAFPTADLAITCPSQASPGYCPDLTVNIAVTGSSGAKLWRLKETARATVPPDEDFTTVQPGPTYTFASEGQYTLYLTGKDPYGRLSTEVAKSIRILKAPKILNVQMANPTPGNSGGWPKTGGTITDGDNIHIGADAQGTDAAEWAAAPTGGGCLADHMSIDLRAISGRSNDSKVAPTKCDLKTTGEQPSRAMVFPVVKAAGTTKYPVGTVLKVTDSDPGSILVDGPGGALRRRQFISIGARRSWAITDASVIKVPTTLVSAIPRLSNMGYRDGSIVRSSTGYYYVYNSVKRPVSKTQLAAWRVPLTTAYRPTATELRAMATGSRITSSSHPAGMWIKYSDGRIYQNVRNKQGVLVRRKLATAGALSTLVPSSQVYPANSSDSRLSVDSWLRGYRDGTLLVLGDGSHAVVARGALRRFANKETFNSLGYATANARRANGLAMPRVNGQSYRIGLPIDRYKITSVVISVTNKAGVTTTAVVLPNTGGLWGLGQLDPVPVGWDFSR